MLLSGCPTRQLLQDHIGAVEDLELSPQSSLVSPLNVIVRNRRSRISCAALVSIEPPNLNATKNYYLGAV